MADVTDLLHGYAYQELLEVSFWIQEMERCTHGLYHPKGALIVVGVLANGRRDGLAAWVCVPGAAGGKLLDSRDGVVRSRFVRSAKGAQYGGISCQRWM